MTKILILVNKKKNRYYIESISDQTDINRIQERILQWPSDLAL
jgi:hypothetical protein